MLRAVCALLCIALAGEGVYAGEPAEKITVSCIAGETESDAARAVVTEAYRRIGVSVTFRPLEAAAALDASRSGEVEAELNRIGGIERSFPELIQIPIPVNSLQGAVFSRKYRFPIQSWSSLLPYRTGVIKGVVFSRDGTAGMEVHVADGYDELLRWIAEDAIDVAVISRMAGKAAILRGGYDDIYELDGVLETHLLYHYVNERRADLAERLEPVLKEMLLDGTTRRLLDESYERILEDAG